MFALNQAQETESGSFEGIPANTDLLVRINLTGAKEAMGETVAPGAPNQFWIHRAEKSCVSQKDGSPYCFPAGVLIKPMLTVVGSKDGKYINSKIFTEFFIQGGAPAETKMIADKQNGGQKQVTFASAEQAGQDATWAILCAANGVKPQSPEGLALRSNPQIETLDDKLVVIRTGAPYNGNSKLYSTPARSIHAVGSKEHTAGMAFGSGQQQTGGFGGQAQQQPQQQAPSQTGGFGGQPQGQVQQPPAGSVGGWGAPASTSVDEQIPF